MQVGVDLIEIDRIQKASANQAGFVQRILTPREEALYQAKSSPQRRAEFLAGRFAAKEAYVKALGCGMGSIWFTDIEVLPNDQGRPIVTRGPVLESIALSISHSRHYATATVITQLSQDQIDQALAIFRRD